MTFSDDIKSKDTNLYPVVIIDKDGNNEIRISTNSTTIGGQYYQPILLNVPSLKESIDIEKRNYKISNVSLSISNYEHDGVRFSETVGDNSFINKSVDIYWISPSVTSISGAKHIYHGWILRYDMDSDKVKLTVEDRSQAKLHKDLPVANIGTGVNVPDKYKNKPIPMVYGYVDRSPCVIEARSLDISGEYNIIADSLNVQMQGNNPLWIFKEETWVQMLENIEEGHYSSWAFTETRQYEVESVLGKIILINSYKGSGSGMEEDYQSGGNPISHNRAVGVYQNLPNGIKQFDLEDNYTNYQASDGLSLNAGIEVAYEMGLTGSIDLWWNGYYNDEITSGWSMFANTRRKNAYQYNYPLFDEDTPIIHRVKGTIVLDNFSQTSDGLPWEYHEVYILIGQVNEIFSTGNIGAWYDEDFAFDDGTEYNNATGSGAVFDYTKEHNVGNTPLSPSDLLLEVYFIPQNLLSGGSAGSANVNIELEEGYPNVSVYPLIDNFIGSNFYANVKGRAMETDGTSPTVPSAIKHILENEIGEIGINTTNGEYSDWIYAFTVKDKINSKKLIEEIASASPYIPRFNNMGQWKFDVIKEYYSQDDIDKTIEDGGRISSSDVISFSYSRTKIEDVITKIEFKYNYNYGSGDFSNTANDDAGYIVEDVLPDGGSGYVRDYYGLIEDDDSTLIIDDERGKYIRDHDTAKKFAKWLLRWKCNQHLKIKLKLPLNYLDIEVGSLISFDEVLGNVLPYGINYKHDAVYGDNSNLGSNLNGQQVFSLFMCTSTNKTLTHIDIEVIQLHNLGVEPLARNSVLGCMTAGNWNTYTGANGFDDGSCVNVFDFIQDLCGLEVNPLDETDFPNNQAGDAELNVPNPAGGYTNEFLPNVFIVGIHDNAIESAKAYWEAGNIPKIYDYSMCTWQNTVYHDITNIQVNILNPLGADNPIISFGNIVDNIITINLTPELIELYHDSGGLWMQFIYTFNTTVEPTFSGDSMFTYNCLRYHEQTGDSASIIQTEQTQANAYFADYNGDSSMPIGQFTTSVFFEKGTGTDKRFWLLDDPDTETMDIYDFTLKYNLSPSENSNPELTEITGQATLRFTGVEEDDINPADMNFDGAFNVLDIVLLANCVTAENYPCVNGDMNDDGIWNVLDIVLLANCVTAENCDG